MFTNKINPLKEKSKKQTISSKLKLLFKPKSHNNNNQYIAPKNIIIREKNNSISDNILTDLDIYQIQHCNICGNVFKKGDGGVQALDYYYKEINIWFCPACSINNKYNKISIDNFWKIYKNGKYDGSKIDGSVLKFDIVSYKLY